MTARITLKYVHWLAPILPTEGARYYLEGISIEPSPAGGCTLVATDGHVLGVVHDKEALADQPMIWRPSQALKRAASANAQNATVDLVAPWGEDINETLPGSKYPDWRRVIPPTPVKPGAGIVKVADLFKFRHVLPHEGALLLMRPSDVGAPVLVMAPSAPEFFGLAMPMADAAMPQLMQEFVMPPWAQRCADGMAEGSAAVSQEAAA